ncbi:Heterokaryon incompatibility protein 6, OR allele [Colletotrichum fructicola Nara gc5]|uniref:Heterokaryon incompatibility protein 6, OR allele n=1 Tax=Colletotrichum fructicola (strain Nara gc5) TaxID=1213859 RepID=A0A7J6JJE3_COLFN|nr:Heterokaryon incompatibility protein 6, OR allele [Colletotrichum fructicola Nara gc5]KAF4885747.1 Heterokaryon incompatibility protein 6, OR allele [Colletotrichum fructicola]
METKSLYEALDPEDKQIRLIRVDSGLETAQITVTLEIASLKDEPSFAALSYVWGDPTITEEISVNGHTSRVTNNLAAALRHIFKQQEVITNAQQQQLGRTVQPISRLWADALCINQNDIEERNQQVAMMGELYFSASVVLSWLSSVDGDLPFTFQTLDSIFREVEIENSGEFEAVVSRPQWVGKYAVFARPRMDDWVRGFKNLAELPYWRRVWIFQEVVLSKNLFYLFPSGAIHRKILEKSVRYLLRLAEASPTLDNKGFEVALAMLRMYTPDFSWLLSKASAASSSGLTRVNNNVAARIETSASGFIHDATNPRDHVYGMLGVAALDIYPDYKKSLVGVLEDYVRAVILEREAQPEECYLAFLSRVPRGLRQRVGLWDVPTWAPCHGVEYRSRPREHNFTARGLSFSRTPTKTSSSSKITSEGHLRLLGCRVQSITRIIDAPDNIPNDQAGRLLRLFDDLLQRLGDTYVTGISTVQALAQTLFRETEGEMDIQPLLARVRRYDDGVPPKGTLLEQDDRWTTNSKQLGSIPQSSFPTLRKHLEREIGGHF